MAQGFASASETPLSIANGGTGANNATNALSNLGAQPYSNYLNPLANGQVGNPNMIIGGNFDTNPWARGTNFASAGFTADRFSTIQSGAGNLAASKIADAPSLAQCGMVVSNCLQVAVGTATTTINAGDFYMLRYKMEGYDWTQIVNRPFTFSVWVKTVAVSGTFCFAFNNSNQGISYIKEVGLTAGVWQQVVINVPASVIGTENYTNGIGLYVDFTVMSGSSFQGTANAWTTQSARFITANQTNGMASTSNNFRFALFKIEPGTQVTPYPYESPQQVLAKCQRYFAKTYSQGTNPGANVGNDSAGGIQFRVANLGSAVQPIRPIWQFPVTMRAVPTMTAYSTDGTANNWRDRNSSTNVAINQITGIGTNSAVVDVTLNSSTTAFGEGHLTANAEL